MKFKKITSVLFILFLSSNVYAQQIVNLILVGNDGVTEDIKKAHSFIIIKNYSGNIFERLDYKLQAPLVMLRTYSDSNLTFQQGKYMEYYPSGELRTSGEYSNNMKSGDWMHYNDTGKVVLTERYENGNMTEAENPDTVKKKEPLLYGDEKEANMDGGVKAWINYIKKTLNPDVGQQSVKGGKVRVIFKINTKGKTSDIYLKKSVEFVLDEESLRVIRESPLWEPAFQNGNKVNAYRIQPLTFIKE